MDNDLDSAVQKQLDAAMPWVGLYIAAASAVCTLAIAADALNGFRRKKLWFPCKYASLNAASLTVLAVAMKLLMDLNTVMIKSETDAIAKFASLLFISTALNSAMPSLGSMNDKELLANVVGLAILIVTITANVAIQIIELQRFLKQATVILVITIPLILMLVSLAMLLSLALSVSTMKRNLKWKYQEKHRAAAALEEEEEEGCLKMDVERQRREMMKYWVMAESSCPQFVIARSHVCAASSIITSFFFIIYTSFHVVGGTNTDGAGKSPYGIYTKWIVKIQSIGPVIAVIVATLRWFVAVMFSDTFGKLQFKVESYWIQTLDDWRICLFAGFEIGPNKCLVDVKWCVLTFCIGLQCFVVLASKALIFFSGFIVTPFVSCFSHINKFARHHDTSSSGDDVDLNLSSYVLLLDGEVELPESFVRSMCREADRIIQIGRRNKPSNLINLLHKSVKNANTSQTTSLLSQDCWTLPVVTLTSIALALPNISQHQHKQLLSSVSEGLSLAKIVEKALDTNAQLKSIRKAASVTWVAVLVYSKWVDIDLRRAFLRCKNCEEVLQQLSNKAEEIVMDLKTEVQDSGMGNPLNWPIRGVAANSMYRICQTILLSSCKEESGEELWGRLCVMIADILADCLTNLPHAITKMCHQNCIEKREKSVHEAFLIMGKTEEVVGIVRQQEKDDEAPTSSDESHLAVTVDC